MSEKQVIPPPPDKPEPYECCGSGCSPCVYDYYYEELEKWEAQHGSLIEYMKQKSQSEKATD